jgi:hypothetical protein
MKPILLPIPIFSRDKFAEFLRIFCRSNAAALAEHKPVPEQETSVVAPKAFGRMEFPYPYRVGRPAAPKGNDGRIPTQVFKLYPRNSPEDEGLVARAGLLAPARSSSTPKPSRFADKRSEKFCRLRLRKCGNRQ